VEDGSERPPQLGASSPSSDGGRGLVLVDALAAGWGWEERPGGKLVWAEISTES